VVEEHLSKKCGAFKYYVLAGLHLNISLAAIFRHLFWLELFTSLILKKCMTLGEISDLSGDDGNFVSQEWKRNLSGCRN